MKRRQFLGVSASAGITSLAIVQFVPASTQKANERIGVLAMGLRGRGGGLLRTFAAQPDVEIVYVCDVDQKVLEASASAIEQQTGRRPKAIKDFREGIADRAVHVLVNGAPDHWHAIPTTLACRAGKDVYVEKPDGHNILESRAMVHAAEKYKRVVQLGTQARSEACMYTAMEFIASGKLGKVRFAKAWESAMQGSIGKPPDSQPPAGVDYDLWLGPAPQRPFNIRRFHGSWRWFFDYGTGDLGNDGVHRLDKALWGLQKALAVEGQSLPKFPQAVSAHGGKHYFDDAQQWPDNFMVTYHYPDALLTYEMRIWTPYPMFEESEGAALLGDKGYIILGNGRWKAFNPKGELVAQDRGEDGTSAHVRNFLECVRTRARPNADLATVGHISSMLCHLGNAAWRVGRTVRFDPQNYRFLGDEEANGFLTRPQYREPWVLPSLEEI